MLGIVISRADSASVHIGEQLRALESWDRRVDDSRPEGDGRTVYATAGAVIREFDTLHLDLDRPADAFAGPTLLVFASRHAGETGPLLTAHHTGNFGPADHGGADDALARACPNAHAHVLEALATYAPEGYDVGMECTHHGPSTVGAPSMFVEVGSTQQQWDDPAAARAVARAILDLRGVSPDRPSDDTDRFRRHLVGFGGGHYAPRFERLVRETDWAVGHVAADWGLDAMGALDNPDSRAVLDRAFEASRAAYALVDGDRPALREAVADCGYRAVGETWVRETDGVSLSLVEAVEDRVLPVSDGLRFGERARTADEEFVVESLPTALLAEARALDREAALDAVRETTLAFVTDQGGTRPTERVVLTDSADRETVLDRLVAVLEHHYDDLDRDGDTLVARKSVFDPEKARTLGVPEGPAFGTLSAGESVEVDGREIPPEEVHDRRERRFSLGG